MQLGFGSGTLWAERTDTTGTGIGPEIFGILQGCSIDIDFDVKELRGQYQFSVDQARGAGKITGRAQFGRIFGALYGDVFFGETPTTAGLIVAENEAGTVPASSTYTVTVTNAANYSDDLGVFYASGASAGWRFKRVTSPSAVGEYSVNLSTGVYTFAAADASASVLISYRYTRSTGKKVTLTNRLSGYTPTFKATFQNQKKTQGTNNLLALTLNACTSSKLSLPYRVDEYTIQEFDFSSFADAAGNIGALSMDE